MSYIGRSPQIGAYHKLDAITTDGSASYTMQLNSGNFVPESVNHLIVSVNGVIQAPTDSFTVSGSTITFASSLSVSDTIDFIMALGNVLDIGVPSDNTVSLSKLTASGTKDATTFLRGDNTFAVPSGGENTPAFEAFLSNDQSLSHASSTKIQFDSEVYDTDGCYDNSTNYRFTPTEAGKYLVYTGLSFKTAGYDIYACRFYIVKNGAVYLTKFNTTNNSVLLETTMNYITTIDMNGSSDYLEIYAYIERHGGSDDQRIESGNQQSRFGAFKLIGVS